jgi:single-strand DNA-binding protein
MSFNKGDKVIVTGAFSSRSWKDKEGVDRTSNEIDAWSVGMDLTRGPVVQKRFERTPALADDKRAEVWTDQSMTVDPVTGEVIPEQVSEPAAA